MKCQRCNDRGFIEAPILMSQGNYGSLIQCCNIQKYSAEIQRRINLHSPKNNVNDAQNTAQQLCVVLPMRKKQNGN